MSIRNTVTAGGFVTALAATEAQLVLSVSDVTTADGTNPVLPVGPVVLRVNSTGNNNKVFLSDDHVVLGNTLVVVSVENGGGDNQTFRIQVPAGGKFIGDANLLTVSPTQTVLLVCVDATAGASRWAKMIA